jgi:hypothetical protein
VEMGSSACLTTVEVSCQQCCWNLQALRYTMHFCYHALFATCTAALQSSSSLPAVQCSTCCSSYTYLFADPLFCMFLLAGCNAKCVDPPAVEKGDSPAGTPAPGKVTGPNMPSPTEQCPANKPRMDCNFNPCDGVMCLDGQVSCEQHLAQVHCAAVSARS